MKNTSRTRNIPPMLIYEKTRDGEQWNDVFSRLAKERIVFLSGEVGSDDATCLCATLLFLDKQNSTKPISIYINSPGGTVTDGLYTIYDTIQFIKSPIETICIGEACSAAAVILASGTKGRRLATENASIMIHQLQCSDGGAYKTAMEVQRKADRVKKMNSKLVKTMADHCGKTVEKVSKDIEHDFYMTAEEALEYGLIDGIVKKTKFIKPFLPQKVTGKRKIKS